MKAKQLLSALKEAGIADSLLAQVAAGLKAADKPMPPHLGSDDDDKEQSGVNKSSPWGNHAFDLNFESVGDDEEEDDVLKSLTRTLVNMDRAEHRKSGESVETISAQRLAKVLEAVAVEKADIRNILGELARTNAGGSSISVTFEPCVIEQYQISLDGDKITPSSTAHPQNRVGADKGHRWPTDMSLAEADDRFAPGGSLSFD